MNRDLKLIIFAGMIGGVVSSMLPSLPTQVWMWKERPQYRDILILSYVLTGIVILILLGYIKG